MKKLLLIFLAMLMIVGFAGCSYDQTSEEVDTELLSPVSIVNKDGITFIPDTTRKGSVAQKELNSPEVELCGKAYTLPIRISDLINDGWEIGISGFKNEFQPRSKTSLISFTMKKDGAILCLGEAFNDTEEIQKLEDCLLTEFYLESLNGTANGIDFVFPGGIIRESTARDVIDVYGDPNNSEIFEEYSYNIERQLAYNKHSETKLNFIYTFDKDGTLMYTKVSVDAE